MNATKHFSISHIQRIYVGLLCIKIKKDTSVHLLRRETLHVGALNDVVEILVQVADVSVDGDFVLPLKLGPHLSELGVSAGRRHDVVHYVDVDVVQHDAVPVTRSSRRVIH